MKKFFTIILAFIGMLGTASAQMVSDMTFVGKSNFYIMMGESKAGETAVESDTIHYAGADFVIPQMKYGEMVIPSFRIQGTKFTGGYAGVTWEDQTFTAVNPKTGEAMSVTGSSLTGTFTHANGIYNLKVQIAFRYGKMPYEIHYAIDSYYVKDYSGTNFVTIGVAPATFGPYSTAVTQRIRTYVDNGETKLDVEVPMHQLQKTQMGDLTIGSYTVKGLTYDATKGGYYRDYAGDGLTMYLKAVNGGITTLEDNYPLNNAGSENILVTFEGSKAKIVNSYKPGAMPFPITAVMDQTSTGIMQIEGNMPQTTGMMYNINGQRVNSKARGIVIINGKKHLTH